MNDLIKALEIDLFDFVMDDNIPELEHFHKLANALYKEENDNG